MTKVSILSKKAEVLFDRFIEEGKSVEEALEAIAAGETIEAPELGDVEELPEDPTDIPTEDLGSVGELEDTVDINETVDLPTDEE